MRAAMPAPIGTNTLEPFWIGVSNLAWMGSPAAAVAVLIPIVKATRNGSPGGIRKARATPPRRVSAIVLLGGASKTTVDSPRNSWQFEKTVRFSRSPPSVF
jgi:hypothetical protein